MTVKTDWTAGDRYNPSDYARMTGNLTAAAGLVGESLPSWPAVSYASITGLDAVCRQIISAYNALRIYADGFAAIAFADRWLLWSECNQIESLCLAINQAYRPRTHEGLAAFTHAELAAYTHEDLKNGG